MRSGKEYLGLIVYEADDAVHPHVCSGAIYIANTLKRLRILDDEKERSRLLEKEVSLRTQALLDANEKLKEEARRRIAVEAEVLRISEMERLRFSLDLHDDICQRLAGISMCCKSLTSGLSPQTLLPELSEMIDETLHLTRQYAHDSFPMELDTLGLNEALARLCHSLNTQTKLECSYSWKAPSKSPLSASEDINVYRIIQEALQNVIKHSKATKVSVSIISGETEFIVRVQDNGEGNPHLEEGEMSPKENRRQEGLGLRSMQYRAHQLNAAYVFHSSKKSGTLVEVRIPLGVKKAKDF